MQKYIINKFGGAIMSSKKTLDCAKKNIKNQIEDGFTPIIVVSAFEGVTDELINLFKNIELFDNNDILENFVDKCINRIVKANLKVLKSINFEENILKSSEIEIQKIYEDLNKDVRAVLSYGMLDVFHGRILSYGEKISSIYFKNFLENERELNVRRFTGEEVGIVTNQKFLDADIGFEISSKNVSQKIKSLDSDVISVITGFSAKTPSGQISTLGRGGSDTTATFMGAALNAQKIILWKNVEGVLSADPNIVKKAKTIKNISYSQAEESGKVICVKAMKYVRISKIPCEVAYICDERKKTIIKSNKSAENGLKLVGIKKDLTLFKFKDESIVRHGFLLSVAEIFSNFGINMVLIRNTKEIMYIVVDKIEVGKFNNVVESLREKYVDIYFEKTNIIVGIGNFDWEDVKIFNDILYNSNLSVEIGAFPYKNNVRLEAVIIGDDVEIGKVLNNLHKQLII